FQLFHQAFEDWNNRLTIDQKKDAESSSLYHYRGGQTDEDEVDEKEFSDIFPSFDDEENKATNSKGITKSSPQIMAKHTATLHSQIFGQERHSVQD
ncbi:hypothetical protein RCL16_25035, partial [Salmonella enterica subsp. enterica serovar 1,4,[5],12:i:-]